MRQQHAQHITVNPTSAGYSPYPQSNVHRGQPQHYQVQPGSSQQLPRPGPGRMEQLIQVGYLENRLHVGLQPLAVAGIAALLMQMDNQSSSYSGQPITISVWHGPSAVSMTFLNTESAGHDLTFFFTDS